MALRMIIRVVTAAIALTFGASQAYAYLTPGEAFGIPVQNDPTALPDAQGDSGAASSTSGPAQDVQPESEPLPTLIPTPAALPQPTQPMDPAPDAPARLSPRIPVRDPYTPTSAKRELPVTVPRETTPGVRVSERQNQYMPRIPQDEPQAPVYVTPNFPETPDYAETGNFYRNHGAAGNEPLPPVGMPWMPVIFVVIASACLTFFCRKRLACDTM